jgi:hypothetical protein
VKLSESETEMRIFLLSSDNNVWGRKIIFHSTSYISQKRAQQLKLISLLFFYKFTYGVERSKSKSRTKDFRVRFKSFYLRDDVDA